MRRPLIAILLAGVFLTAELANAQPLLESGTFLSEDARYTITVESTPDGMVVVEPNQRSNYVSIGRSHFRYTSPRGIEYGIFIHSATEIETYTVGRNGPGTDTPGTRFTRRADIALAEDVDDHFDEIAQKYYMLAQERPADVLLYTFCAGVAFARGNLDEANQQDHTRQAVANLKLLMEAGAANPCPDAIPDAAWQQ